MEQTSEEDRAERARLREIARTADSEAERRAAISRLAALDRERNRDTYGTLACE